MEKHVGLNPAWFEPGADGVSPFEREYRSLECAEISTRISAAFRALLAQDADEIARLCTEVEQLREELSRVINISADRVAERDALRARIDAGVRAWEKWKQQCGSLWLWAFPGATASQAWSDVCDALDADYVVYPIADHIADPGKMADERKGERRVVNIITPYFRRQNYFRDRRRTAGTIADRKEAL